MIVLAHHSLILALPFAAPALTVSAGVAFMAWRARGEDDLD
jgi:hypothetical protein